MAEGNICHELYTNVFDTLSHSFWSTPCSDYLCLYKLFQAIIQYSHLIFKRNFPEKLTAPWFMNSQREQQHWNIQSKDDWTGIEEPQNCSIYQPMSIFFIQLYLIDILPKWFLFLNSFWHGATGLQHRYRRDVKLLHLKGHLHFDLCLGEVTTNDLCYITKVLPNANGEGCRNLGGTLHMGITGTPTPSGPR